MLFGSVFPPGSLLEGSLKLSEIHPGLLSGRDVNYCWERLGCGGPRGGLGEELGLRDSYGHGEGDPEPQSWKSFCSGLWQSRPPGSQPGLLMSR